MTVTYNEKYLNYAACPYEHSKFLLLYFAGNTERIIQGLEKVTDLNIYRKGSAALKQLHYNDNERIHPIVLVGNEGVVIVNNATKSKIKSGKYLRIFDQLNLNSGLFLRRGI